MLQMANRPALEDLFTFNRDPTPYNASRLVGIPVLYNLLKEEGRRGSMVSSSVVLLCEWIYRRGQKILKLLIVHRAPSREVNMVPAAARDWEEVCFYYQ